MKKVLNLIYSIATIAFFVLYIYSIIKGEVPFGETGTFLLQYGALILAGLFTFNNLLAKVMSGFLVIFILVAIVLVILFVNPSLITNLFG